MRDTLDVVMARLRERFPGGPPGDELVRDHRVTFLRSHWSNQLPGLSCPVLDSVEERITVSRRELFDAARDAETEEGVLDLYVKVAGWGSGTSARSIARCARVLRQNNAVATLSIAREASIAASPVEAYRRMNTRSDLRIKYLGPAFFTKWLYFTGYDQRELKPAPLILDARVATAIGWKRKWGWRSAAYGEYLEAVEQVRAEWGPGATAHVVEYSLFKAGGKPSRK